MSSATSTMSALVVPSTGRQLDRWDLDPWPPPAGGGVPLEAVAKRRRGCFLIIDRNILRPSTRRLGAHSEHRCAREARRLPGSAFAGDFVMARTKPFQPPTPTPAKG